MFWFVELLDILCIIMIIKFEISGIDVEVERDVEGDVEKIKIIFLLFVIV